MRVFVTGATGFIGTAVVRELQASGHQVVGLARNEAAADALATVGAEAHRGELSNIDSLVAGARAADGVIHLGFVHDFAKYDAAIETDRRAIAALSGALEGSSKPLVVTFGTLGVAHDRTATEDDPPLPPDRGGNPRGASEALVLSAAERGVRASIVRLAPSVHGAGDHGFVPTLINIAREKGFAAHVNDGSNRWPAVHRLDAARLFRLALEKAEPGARLHAVAEQGVPMRSIAETIAEGLGLPIRSLTADEAPAHFGWMAAFVGLDAPASNALTRERTGWTPQQPDLLVDIRASSYFAS